MVKPRCLGVCLFYNDDDIAEDAIKYLLENNHELVVWDHGSNDRTSEILDRFRPYIRERHFLPRSFDFYKIFEHVSRYVIQNYAPEYDWISFPESDEFLEGPDRKKSYYNYVCDVVDSPYDWIQFDNIVFWFTDKDNLAEYSPRRRIRHYSVWTDCLPRIYAWRARCMNVRWFNHNPAEGLKFPVNFNTCHYHVRSEEHMIKRINNRIGLSRGTMNTHFDFMAHNINKMRIPADRLHLDNGIDDLLKVQTFNWKEIYNNLDALQEQMRPKNTT
jgi:hypothetical protein